jgi:heptose-I-phosphate ethanolaminephosphotransferase
MTIGVLFYALPVLINQWTLMYFFGDYIGDTLSGYMVMLLWLFAAVSVATGWAFIKNGLCILRELWVIFLFSAPLVMTTAYLFFSFIKDGRIAEIFYGEMLCIFICTLLTFLFFRWGILLGFQIVILVVFVEIMYACMYKTVLNPSVFFNIFETNRQEVIGYLWDYLFNYSTLILVVIAGLASLVVFKTTRNLNRKRLNIFLIVLSTALFLPLLIPHARQRILPNNFFMKMPLGYLEYSSLYEEINALSKKSLDEIETISFSKPQPQSQLHVLIIGESADRQHMGIYGYKRNNTPLMQEMADELFLFDDVISVHLNTIPNMKKILTFANYESDEDFVKKGSMIHYLKKAGLQTHWISNQNPMGINDTMTTVIAKASDSVRFINYSESSRDASLDNKILPVFKEIISQDDKGNTFIIIHLMGSHGPFKLRYTKEYDRFKGSVEGMTQKQSEIINQYDNSILYTDYILTEIINRVKETQKYASVLYISDHGLEIFDQSKYYGHSLHAGLEVPFILWLSDQYKVINADKVANFNDYLDRKYTTDDMIFSICDLLNLKFESFEPNRSIFNQSFKQKKRYIGTPDKKAIWDYDLRKLKN